jgi:hypothetical protein
MNGRDIDGRAVAAIIFLWLLVASCNERAKPEAGELGVLGQQVGFAFPAGTRLVGVERFSGMDDMVRFKVAIPRVAWPSFQKALPIQPTEMAAGAGRLGPNRDWWDPRRPNLRSGYKQRPGARAIRIGVDDSDPVLVTLYIEEQGT